MDASVSARGVREIKVVSNVCGWPRVLHSFAVAACAFFTGREAVDGLFGVQENETCVCGRGMCSLGLLFLRPPRIRPVSFSCGVTWSGEVCGDHSRKAMAASCVQSMTNTSVSAVIGRG